MFPIEEIACGGGQMDAIENRVGGHIVVGGREGIFDAALNHAGLPELGLEIHLAAIDVHLLFAVDIQSLILHADEIRFLEVMSGCFIAVVVYIDGQLALQFLAKRVRIVQVCRVLGCSGTGVGGRLALQGELCHIGHRIRSLNIPCRLQEVENLSLLRMDFLKQYRLIHQECRRCSWHKSGVVPRL